MLNKLIEIIENIKADVVKFEDGGRGSNGMGTKIRAAMQELKAEAQSIREKVTSIRENRKK